MLSAMTILTGCASNDAPLPTPEQVDLERFMGPWYVVGYSPLFLDNEAHNAVEHYFLAANGDIQTTYQFRNGSFTGKLKTYTPVGRVFNQATNAEWRMQFVWPFEAKYVILYLSEDYQRTIIAHPNRKYAWIMQRTPEISTEDYEAMLAKLQAVGFKRDAVKRLPHDWSVDVERREEIEAIGASRPLAER
jgi:apolipoprotein D and lipocalin family protein